MAPTLIVATGAKWRELGVPGEKEHIGRGVAFCPHCDGPFYKGRPVAVVGGGNSGVEAAIDLSGICTHVTLIEFADELKADAVLVKNLQEQGERHHHHLGAHHRGARRRQQGGRPALREPQDQGAGRGGARRRVRADRTVAQQQAGGDLVELNKFGEIVVDGKGRTSVPGIYAAGDVTTVPFKQIVIAMGEGAKAALTAFEDNMRSEPSAA